MALLSSPRAIAQTAFGLSLGTSIMFNVQGTMLVTDAPAAVITSAVWSGFSLLGVEIMTKVKFPAKRRGAKHNPWNLVRFGGVGAVALLSMILSFDHAYATMIHWNAGVLNAIMAPLAVDGMLLLSGLVLLVSPVARKRRKPAAKPVRRLRAA